MEKFWGFFRKTPVIELTPDQKKKIASDLAVTNYKRLRIFLGITLLFEILLVVFNDIPALTNSAPGDIWLPQAYLVLHVIIGVTSLLCVILFVFFINKLNDITINYLTPLFCLVILVCLSIITGLDQIRTGEISVFVINLLVCGLVVLTPPSISFFLFTIPFGVFIAELFQYQQIIAIRNSHLINGGIFWVAVLLLSKFNFENHVSHVIKNIKLEIANQKLLTLSTHDPLTDLSNRRHFEEQIDHELSRIRRFDEQSWLILVDIDHFKQINDHFGHAIGDHVIKEIASLLQKNIRDVDLACRWGGEEYLLLIARVGMDEALMIGNRLCNGISNASFDIDGQKIKVTASLGIARLTAHDPDMDDFKTSYKRVDQAMYSAKAKGRNQVDFVN